MRCLALVSSFVSPQMVVFGAAECLIDNTSWDYCASCQALLTCCEILVLLYRVAEPWGDCKVDFLISSYLYFDFCVCLWFCTVLQETPVTSNKIVKVTMASYCPLQDKTEHDSQQGEDYDHLLPQEESLLRKSPQRTPTWVFITGIPIISILLVGFGVWIGSQWPANFNAKCLQHVQHWCKFTSC